MGCGLTGTVHALAYPPDTLALQPFQRSLHSLPDSIFSHHFMQPLQQIKEIILAQSNNTEDEAYQYEKPRMIFNSSIKQF